MKYEIRKSETADTLYLHVGPSAADMIGYLGMGDADAAELVRRANGFVDAIEFLRTMVEFEDARRVYWESQTPETLAEHERTVIAFQEAIPKVRAFCSK